MSVNWQRAPLQASISSPAASVVAVPTFPASQVRSQQQSSGQYSASPRQIYPCVKEAPPPAPVYSASPARARDWEPPSVFSPHSQVRDRTLSPPPDTHADRIPPYSRQRSLSPIARSISSTNRSLSPVARSEVSQKICYSQSARLDYIANGALHASPWGDQVGFQSAPPPKIVDPAEYHLTGLTPLTSPREEPGQSAGPITAEPVQRTVQSRTGESIPCVIEPRTAHMPRLAEIRALKEEVSAERAARIAVERELANLVKESAALRQREAKNSVETTSLRSGDAAAGSGHDAAEIAQLRKRLEERDIEAQDQRVQIASLRRSLSDQEENVARQSLGKEVTLWEKERSCIEARVSLFEHAEHEELQEIEDLRSELQEMQDEGSELRRKLVMSLQDQGALNVEANSLREALMKMSCNIAEQEDAQGCRDNMLYDLESRGADSRAEASTFRIQLVQRDAEFATLRAEEKQACAAAAREGAGYKAEAASMEEDWKATRELMFRQKGELDALRMECDTQIGALRATSAKSLAEAQEFRRMHSELDAELTQRNEQLTMALVERERTGQEVTALEAKVNDREMQLKIVQEKVDRMMHEGIDARQALDICGKGAAAARSELSQKKIEVQKLQQEWENLNSERLKEMKDTSDLQEKFMLSNSELAAFSQEVKLLARSMGMVDPSAEQPPKGKVAELVLEKLAALRREAATSLAEAKNLRVEFMSEAAQVKKMPAQFMGANHVLREELSSVESASRIIESDLRHARKSEEEMQRKMEDATREGNMLRELRNEASRSRCEVEALATQMGAQAAAANSEEEALRRANQELHGVLLQSDVAMSEVRDLRRQLGQRDARVGVLGLERIEELTEGRRARDEVLELQSQARVSNAEVMDLRMQISGLQEQVSKFRDEAIAAEKKTSCIRVEAAELCAQAAEQAVGMRKEVSDRDTDVHVLRRIADVCSADAAVLQAELEQKNNEVEVLQRTVEMISAGIASQLRDEVSSFEERLRSEMYNEHFERHEVNIYRSGRKRDDELPGQSEFSSFPYDGDASGTTGKSNSASMLSECVSPAISAISPDDLVQVSDSPPSVRGAKRSGSTNPGRSVNQPVETIGLSNNAQVKVHHVNPSNSGSRSVPGARQPPSQSVSSRHPSRDGNHPVGGKGIKSPAGSPLQSPVRRSFGGGPGPSKQTSRGSLGRSGAQTAREAGGSQASAKGSSARTRNLSSDSARSARGDSARGTRGGIDSRVVWRPR